VLIINLLFPFIVFPEVSNVIKLKEILILCIRFDRQTPVFQEYGGSVLRKRVQNLCRTSCCFGKKRRSIGGLT
jgi:hypothetical protein